MNARWEDVLERAQDNLGALPDAARPDAESLLQLCALVFAPGEAREAKQGSPRAPSSAPSPAQRDIARLIELLGRRSSKAIPFATLGRAAMAHLAGADRDRDALLAEADLKFTLLGS